MARARDRLSFCRYFDSGKNGDRSMKRECMGAKLETSAKQKAPSVKERKTNVRFLLRLFFVDAYTLLLSRARV